MVHAALTDIRIPCASNSRMNSMVRNIPFKPSFDTPHQAWLAKLQGGELECIAGAGVRRDSDWFFEGGWARVETPRSLSRSGIYLGSGAVWDGTVLSAIAPSHTTEAVYITTTPDAIFVSNSLPFVLAGAGITDFPITELREPMESIIKGLDHYSREIHATSRYRVYRFCNAIIQCRQGEEPLELPQEADLSGIDSFETYRDYLISVIQEASRTYGSTGISVYLSSGYDSTACAALAKHIGGDRLAISVDMARTRVADAGTHVAQALGMRIATLSRADREIAVVKNYVGQENATDTDIERMSEFYIGMNVMDECLSAPPELLAGRTVLTGFHGDKIWDPTLHPSLHLKRGDSSGASIGDFRLRIGFLHIPVPMLAFSAHPLLQTIGLSREMRPWRNGKALRVPLLRHVTVPVLGIKTHPLLERFWHAAWVPKKALWWRNRGTYDRPIPRRMAEEVGVQRKAFGQQKLAAATLASNLDDIAPKLFRTLMLRYERPAQILHEPVHPKQASRKG
jgi:hypothetical protein